MATLKQIDANRRNALLSTGPRTDAGKQSASRNALKSGIFAEAEVIPGEDPAALAKLTAEHHARFPPTTSEARDLVDSLIRNAWLLRRLARAEAAIFACDCKNCTNLYHDAGEARQISGRYTWELKKFEVLQRRINAAERNYHRALKALQTLPVAPQNSSGDSSGDTICENEPNFPQPIEAAPTESTAYQSDPIDPGALAPILPPDPDPRIPNPAFRYPNSLEQPPL